MEKQELINRALLGIKNPCERLQSAGEVSGVKKYIKNLAQMSLMGLMMAGCSSAEDSGIKGEIIQETHEAPSNLVTGFDASNCQDIFISAAYEEPITIVASDITDADNSISMDLDGSINEQTGELSFGQKSFNSPISEKVILEVTRQSDLTPVQFCHLHFSEDCIRGDDKPRCQIVREFPY